MTRRMPFASATENNLKHNCRLLEEGKPDLARHWVADGDLATATEGREDLLVPGRCGQSAWRESERARRTVHLGSRHSRPTRAASARESDRDLLKVLPPC